MTEADRRRQQARRRMGEWRLVFAIFDGMNERETTRASALITFWSHVLVDTYRPMEPVQ